MRGMRSSQIGGCLGCGTPEGCRTRKETAHPPPRERPPSTRLPRRLPTRAPPSAGPRTLGFQLRPWCRLHQLLPPRRAADGPGDLGLVLRGGPRAAPLGLHGSGASPTGADARARPSPPLAMGLLWSPLWGRACWGAVCTTPRCLGGRARLAPFLAPRHLPGSQTSPRLQNSPSERTKCSQASGAQVSVSWARVQVPDPRAAAWASILHPPRPPTLASPQLHARGRAPGWEAPTPRARDPIGLVLPTLSRAGQTLL